jgi:hypothetical protein
LELGEHRNGFGLVATRRRGTDLRKKEVVLTPEGRELADRMVGYWRNEPEIVREYQERMASDEEEKKKVIELRNRYRTFEPDSEQRTGNVGMRIANSVTSTKPIERSPVLGCRSTSTAWALEALGQSKTEGSWMPFDISRSFEIGKEKSENGNEL